MRDDVLFQSRLSRERDRERRDGLRIHTTADLQPVPRASLEILCRDRVRVEVASAHQMQRAAHEARAYDGVLLLDRGPETLALESLEPRPERDVRRRRPLRLQRREALDRGHDRDGCSLEEHLARERGAIQLAQREHRSVHRRARAHAFTPCVFESG